MASWWQRHRDAFVHDLVIGLVISVPIFAATVVLDHRAAERQEILENVRFVRERGSEAHGVKPFVGLNLRGANLAFLRLGCSNDAERIAGLCANFRESDLSNADLLGADLTGAFLDEANLSGANLQLVDFTRASLGHADLRGATFAADDGSSGLDAEGLEDADLQYACWNEKTRWPRDFKPLRSYCD